MQATRQKLIDLYNRVIGGVDEEATGDDERAYGGVLRATKGKLVEKMTPHIIRLAWQDTGGSPELLSFGNTLSYKAPVQPDYDKQLPEEIRNYINVRRSGHFYRAKVDLHVFIDKEFIMGIECKSYTENAMLKRILVDFRILKSLHSNLVCCLLQLESMLGGGYSEPLASPQFGSPSSHTLMSYFPEVQLNIITLLQGERKVNEPIHKKEHFKELSPESLDRAINQFSELLAPFAT